MIIKNSLKTINLHFLGKFLEDEKFLFYVIVYSVVRCALESIEINLKKIRRRMLFRFHFPCIGIALLYYEEDVQCNEK